MSRIFLACYAATLACVIERDDIGSWLNGPTRGGGKDSYPGSRLGLPEKGAGSLARPGRRIIALAVDWALCLMISGWLFEGSALATLLIFAIENLLLVGTLGSTLGHRLMGMRVVRTTGAWATPWRVAVRTLLLCLVIPAAIYNAEGRGGHDIAAGTVLLRR